MASSSPNTDSKFNGFGPLDEEQQGWILRTAFRSAKLGPCIPEVLESFRAVIEQAGTKPAIDLFKEFGFHTNHSKWNGGKPLDADDMAQFAGNMSLEEAMAYEARQELNGWVEIMNKIVETGIAVQEKHEAERKAAECDGEA